MVNQETCFGVHTSPPIWIHLQRKWKYRRDYPQMTFHLVLVQLGASKSVAPDIHGISPARKLPRSLERPIGVGFPTEIHLLSLA